MTATTRVERDSMGALDVPASALWGAQTQRAMQNFPPSGPAHAARLHPRARRSSSMPRPAPTPSWAICRRPWPAAIQAAALDVAAGRYDDQFPVDVFQTGSGTSSNMNANEVIATLAARALGASRASERSSEHEPEQQRRGADGDPCRRGAAAARAACCRRSSACARSWAQRAAEFAGMVKTGRTHLMDAMPITLAQELGRVAGANRRPAKRA